MTPFPARRRVSAAASRRFHALAHRLARAFAALVLAGLAAGFASVGPQASAVQPVEDDRMAEFDRWTWPTPPPVAIASPFRAPPTPYAAGHRGVDLRAAAGASVLAPADGVVSFSGMVAGRPVVSIDHGDGVISSMEPVVSAVPAGTAVSEGRPVGTVGTGGHCEGCVHLGVRVDGAYVSPMLFLGGVPFAVLLPLT
ncbi:murein DD-endopeptidase MepM/ murein hydrolase activator NlpD [Agromyces terreus]|uniref:Murein DD-endopeptidase MepM/ murein hydrolase activator NlpD n=1 Tax=Agromyces terreus TaxID=424795 RepID=A0A9X2H3C6_9MICO|nr:M23 family metallopeptidase [Agromyces terreus]MCP2372208.1 murein DD-endopeptidase MepM/ murein hydrolase activator NlpD [Agromyces terreus]